LEPLVCPFLIHSHQARVARHIGGEDSGETADRGHGVSGGGSGLTKSILKLATAPAFSGTAGLKRGSRRPLLAHYMPHHRRRYPVAVLGPDPVITRRIRAGMGLRLGPGRTR
jgi:hypothetical protein